MKLHSASAASPGPLYRVCNLLSSYYSTRSLVPQRSDVEGALPLLVVDQ